jgi:hypothetical protein
MKHANGVHEARVLVDNFPAFAVTPRADWELVGGECGIIDVFQRYYFSEPAEVAV